MPRYFFNPFAVSGDLVAVPTAVQLSGSVSYASGFGFDYQRDLLTDPAAKAVPRGQSNQIYFDITSNIQQYQQHGFPEFITTSDNEGTPFPYAKYAVVRYNDGVNGFRLYQSLVDANTLLPTDESQWVWLDPDATLIPTGAIIDFGMGASPSGFLACNGASYLRTDYPKLFAKITTTWGSADGSHFNVPDLRRRVRMGVGGASTPTIGNAVGNTTAGGPNAETTTLVRANLAPHDHTGTTFKYDNIGVTGGGPSASILVNDSSGAQTYGVNVATDPGSPATAFNIVQASAIVFPAIKT